VIVVTDTSVVLNLCWLPRESQLFAIYKDVLPRSRSGSRFALRCVGET